LTKYNDPSIISIIIFDDNDFKEQVYLEKGKEFFQKKDYKKALDYMNKVVSNKPFF